MDFPGGDADDGPCLGLSKGAGIYIYIYMEKEVGGSCVRNLRRMGVEGEDFDMNYFGALSCIDG